MQDAVLRFPQINYQPYPLWQDSGPFIFKSPILQHFGIMICGGGCVGTVQVTLLPDLLAIVPLLDHGLQ